MAFNLTGLGESLSVLDMIVNIDNVLLENKWGMITILVISIITFIYVQESHKDAKISLITSGFVAFTLSLFLWALELVSPLVIFIAVAITAIFAAIPSKD